MASQKFRPEIRLERNSVIPLCAQLTEQIRSEIIRNRLRSGTRLVSERRLADELEIPLLRFDFPVFDRICLTKRPYIGAEGTLCLLEDLFCEAFAARTLKGAIYQ